MINIVVLGFGTMGKKTIEELNKKESVHVSAVIDINPMFAGKYTSDYINSYKQIPIYNSIESVEWEDVHLAILTTASFLIQVESVLVQLANRKVNVLTIAEEMSYPEATDKQITKKLDNIAVDNNITILGTGINPGFILDLFIIVLSNTCLEINEINAIRVNDLSEFGETVMRSQGVGLSVKEFEESVRNNEVVGHVGFSQSIHLIAKAFKWELKSIKQELEPIITDENVTVHGEVINKGNVIGCNHKAVAFFENNKSIKFEHPQQVCLNNIGKTRDEIKIRGVPNIEVKIEPEIPGGIGTIAMIINMIPLVLESRAGLINILDLPRLPTIFN